MSLELGGKKAAEFSSYRALKPARSCHINKILSGIRRVGKCCKCLAGFIPRMPGRKRKVHADDQAKLEEKRKAELEQAKAELEAERKKVLEEERRRAEEDGEDDRDEESKLPPSSSSSYILEEWYKNLRSQDTEFQRLKDELQRAKRDVTEMRDEFKEAIEMMITQIMTKVYKDREDAKKKARKNLAPEIKMLPSIAFDQAFPAALPALAAEPAAPAAAAPVAQATAIVSSVDTASSADPAAKKASAEAAAATATATATEVAAGPEAGGAPEEEEPPAL
eukprot:g1330.t1